MASTAQRSSPRLNCETTKGRFEGYVAVVTGGSQGIGKAIVERFVNDGAQVAFLDVKEEQGLIVQNELRAKGGKVTFIKCDVADKKQCEAAVKQVIAEYKKINCLVNNAAYFAPMELPGIDTPHEVWDKAMSVNIEGCSNMVQACYPYMKLASDCSVVNFGSTAGLRPDPAPGRWAYGATKAAIINLTQFMAADLVKDGIRVNCVSPGGTLTPAMEVIMEDDPDKWLANVASWHMLGRLADPAEIAAVVAFLCSKDASFITSANIVADGGLTPLTKQHRP